MRFNYIVILSIILVLVPGNAPANPKGKAIALERVEAGKAYTPRVLGMFIGIQEYDDPFWHDLKFPGKDVSDMVAFFTDNPALKLDYQMVLTKSSETTRDYIFNRKFDEFDMKNTSDQDIVIVYISSHGTLTKELMTIIKDGQRIQEARKVPYILTSDTKEGKIADSALALDKVIQWFERLRSQRKVLILDMCHSDGSGKSQLAARQAELIQSAKGISYTPMEDSQASIILSSCPLGGTSYEDNTLQNSIYTHFLLEGMRKGDLDGDGAISISEAHNYSIDKTHQYTWENKAYKQIPTSYSKILGKDPIIVSGKVSNIGNPTLFSYASKNYGVAVFLDGRNKGMLPKGIPVKPGGHTLECMRDGQLIFSEYIDFQPGHDYMLPYFGASDPDDRKWLCIVESGLRIFNSGDVPEDLIRNGFVMGASIYRYGFESSWLGISGGVDISPNEDAVQYAVRAGLKFTSAIDDNARIFIGPDLMYMIFKYKEDTIGFTRVDKDMTFLCPGMEGLFAYNINAPWVITASARLYYLPYEINSETNNVIFSQISLAVGYSF